MGKNEGINSGNSGLLNQALSVFNARTAVTKQMHEIHKEINDYAEQKILQVQNTSIIPLELRGKTQELIEINKMAEYKGVPFLNLVNNIQFIDGKMGWKSTYIIACINKASDRFSAPLNYRSVGKDGDKTYGKRAYTYDLKGNLIEGPVITLDIADRAGWSKKENSSWNTLPELMLCYRAATLFGRLFAPDILDGLHTIDELVDIYSVSGSLPKNSIDQKVLEVIKESEAITLHEARVEVKTIIEETKPKIKTKSILDAMIEDFERNSYFVSAPTFHKDKWFLKVEPENKSFDQMVLMRWDFNKTPKGTYIKDISSIMTEDEKNEYK